MTNITNGFEFRIDTYFETGRQVLVLNGKEYDYEEIEVSGEYGERIRVGGVPIHEWAGGKLEKLEAD